MGLFAEDEEKNTATPISEEIIYGKAFLIIKAFRQLTAKHPEHYFHLETFPIDMVHAMLRYLVNSRRMNEARARQFKEKYLDTALIGADLERTLFYMGEDKFDEMVNALLKLVAPYIK